MLEFAINSQLNATHGQQPKPRFSLSRSDQFADPELPLPDTGQFGSGDGIFNALVNHGIPPEIHKLTPMEQRCST
jgi:hypothetical protein